MSDRPSDDDLRCISLGELAGLLGISERWCQDQAKRGSLFVQAYRFGRLWRVRRADVEAYLNQGSRPAAEPAGDSSSTAPIRRRVARLYS